MCIRDRDKNVVRENTKKIKATKEETRTEKGKEVPKDNKAKQQEKKKEEKEKKKKQEEENKKKQEAEKKKKEEEAKKKKQEEKKKKQEAEKKKKEEEEKKKKQEEENKKKQEAEKKKKDEEEKEKKKQEEEKKKKEEEKKKKEDKKEVSPEKKLCDEIIRQCKEAANRSPTEKQGQQHYYCDKAQQFEANCIETTKANYPCYDTCVTGCRSQTSDFNIWQDCIKRCNCPAVHK
eukprot:TRINITY_DN12216_c0_g3_i1.p2 TRINITY_DN12216_c0_g3~~TRINITY_DN12216_c0_g3_i1.p2  ORF type:complete len:233 (+),score=124.23 TRINITY_DN12216_c0_g3_i1:65-763(+)